MALITQAATIALTAPNVPTGVHTPATIKGNGRIASMRDVTGSNLAAIGPGGGIVDALRAQSRRTSALYLLVQP